MRDLSYFREMALSLVMCGVCIGFFIGLFGFMKYESGLDQQCAELNSTACDPQITCVWNNHTCGLRHSYGRALLAFSVCFVCVGAPFVFGLGIVTLNGSERERELHKLSIVVKTMVIICGCAGLIYAFLPLALVCLFFLRGNSIDWLITPLSKATSSTSVDPEVALEKDDALAETEVAPAK